MLETTNPVPNEKITTGNKCDVVDESDPQRQREGQQASGENSSNEETCYDLSRFRTVRVLNNNSTYKSVCLLGHFTNLSTEQFAIVVLEKRAFTVDQVTTAATVNEPPTQREKLRVSESENGPAAGEENPSSNARSTFFTASSILHKEFVNYIYGNFTCTVDPELNRLKVTIIYPATEKHIAKYSARNRFFIEETADLYRSVTLPHLEQGQFSLEWLYNILEHRKEKERIIYEDPSEENGFILLPDLKWDGKTVEQLYLLALVRRRDIRSLRDLTAEHLPLLRNVQSRAIAAIKERYGIDASELRNYIHYQPTFYHLHMHFTYLRHDPPGISCERAHLLSTVISNIELLPDYYQRATLSYVLEESDTLYEKIVAAETTEPPAAKKPKVHDTEQYSPKTTDKMVPSSTGNIERVLIEMRPRLQSANFFIAFRRNFVDIESTTIDLANDRLRVAAGKGTTRERYEIRVGDFFQLHTQTLSSLVIKNRYLCFRVNTNESEFGSELLNVKDAGGGAGEYELLKLAVNIEPDKRYLLLCSNCGGSLAQQTDDGSEGIMFRRVLELPSEQMDADEWFCHRHDHSSSSSSSCGSEKTHAKEDCEVPGPLEPKQCDLLYGPFYALLHRTVLQRVHIRNDRFVYCRRCLQFLGTNQKSRPCVKLWYEGIRFRSADADRVPMALFRVDEPLELFRILVRKTVRECNFVTHLGLPPMFKLMFELRRPGLEGDVFYLLMQIMDSGLSVFRIDQKETDFGSGSCSEDIDDVCVKENTMDKISLHPSASSQSEEEDHVADGLKTDTPKVAYNDADDDDDDDEDDEVFIEPRCRKHNISLRRHRAMKLMYSYEKYEQQPLFTFWREDSNVVNLELSEPMFTAAIRYLDDNSKYVPECYRTNLGFSMSYLDIT